MSGACLGYAGCVSRVCRVRASGVSRACRVLLPVAGRGGGGAAGAAREHVDEPLLPLVVCAGRVHRLTQQAAPRGRLRQLPPQPLVQARDLRRVTHRRVASARSATTTRD
eukprot:416836-Prorocentrum_minimum.AAC.2